jgi:hypothetical protein
MSRSDAVTAGPGEFTFTAAASATYLGGVIVASMRDRPKKQGRDGPESI